MVALGSVTAIAVGVDSGATGVVGRAARVGNVGVRRLPAAMGVVVGVARPRERDRVVCASTVGTGSDGMH
jgi:hypothetical protein